MWRREALGSVLEVKYGKGLPREKRSGGRIPVYGSNGVVGWHDSALTSGPTIVIGRKGSFGEVHLSKGPCWPIDTTFFIDDAGPFDFEFLTYSLRALGLTEKDRSSAIPGLSREDLYALEIAIPPVQEQEDIRILLRTSETRKNKTAQQLHEVLESLSDVRREVLLAACSGTLTAEWRSRRSSAPIPPPPEQPRPRKIRRLTEFPLSEIPSGWSWMQLHDVLLPRGLFDGPFGSNLKSTDYRDRGARVVRLENIGHLQFIGEKAAFVSEEKYQGLIRHAVYPGDIVFSSFLEENIRVCMLPSDLPEQTLAKADCFTIRANQELVSHEYLLLQLASPWTYAFMEPEIHGMTRPRVNTTQLRALPLPVCSRKEQDEIVRRARSAHGVIDGVSERVSSAQRRLDELQHAILARAMRSEESAA